MFNFFNCRRIHSTKSRMPAGSAILTSISSFTFNFLTNMPKKLSFLLYSCLILQAKADESITYFMDPTNSSVYEFSVIDWGCIPNFVDYVLTSCNASAALPPYPTSFDHLTHVVSCGSPGGPRFSANFYRAVASKTQVPFESCISDAMELKVNPPLSDSDKILLYEILGGVGGLALLCCICYIAEKSTRKITNYCREQTHEPEALGYVQQNTDPKDAVEDTVLSVNI